jgi:hypothetical protein
MARLTDWNLERRLRYLPYWAQAWVWLTRRPSGYELLSVNEVRERKRSDTLFILGSGPSIRRVQPSQWEYIGQHESFGINFSLLLDFVPTYHLMEDGKVAWHRALTRGVLAPRRRKLSPTIWFISNRHTRRLIHPRYTPELFPEPAKVCIFQLPERLLLERDRPFTAADLENSVRYRGTMSLALYLGMQLGYKRIVLLGVDLHTPRHFFEDMEEMRAYMENVPRDQLDDGLPFPVMIPKDGMYRPLDEYLYALNELHFSRKGIELYMGHRDSMLCPRIPYFSDWDE